MAINRKQTVDIVEDLVGLINTELTGTSAWVDNGDGTYTIALCNTYWLNTMETVTIDSVEFTNLVVVKDTSLTVTGVAIPTALTFFLDVPSYYHGTVIQTNEEITISNPNVTARTPMVYLLEILSDDFKSDEDSLERTSDLRLFFLTEADEKNWETDTHYTDAIDPMRKMVSFFVDEVLKKSKGLGRIDDYTVTNHANFGVYTTDKGHTKKIFNDSYSGCELKITLPIKEDMSCGCDGVFAKIKYVDSDTTIKSSDYGSTIVCTPTGACADGTVNVNKSDATLISAETVTSGGTANYNVGDSTVKSSGTVYTSTVKATETFTIPDVSWTDSDATAQTTEYGAAISCAACPVIPQIYNRPCVSYMGYASYQTGDEANLADTIYTTNDGVSGLMQVLDSAASDITTLKYNSTEFGNKIRFTDDAGVDVYGNNAELIKFDNLQGIIMDLTDRSADNRRTLAANITQAGTLSRVINGNTYNNWYVMPVPFFQTMYDDAQSYAASTVTGVDSLTSSAASLTLWTRIYSGQMRVTESATNLNCIFFAFIEDYV